VPPPPLSVEELLHLREVSRAVDESLERSLLAREGMDQTFARLLPEVLRLTGARAVVVKTRDEHLEPRIWSAGDLGDRTAEQWLSPREAPAPQGEPFVAQPLDVVGTSVGMIGLRLPREWGAPAELDRARRALEAVAEALDTVLEAVHTAGEKQQIVLKFSQQLAHSVFEAGLDRAILSLSQHLRLPGFLLVHRDSVEGGTLHYRMYRDGHLEHDSAERRFAPLDEAVARHGDGLVARGDERLRAVVEPHRALEAVLISSVPGEPPLGKILVWSEDRGFSSFTLDVVHLLAATLTQRLIDYNRERTHLSQFFSCVVIDQLIREPHYEQAYLASREEEVGILFADINGFTRICERVLETPARIGRFVDRWSDAVVEVLWKHGGVFDKMVGDCVIGLFGPPFFRTSRLERVEAAVRAAFDIQRVTAAMSADPELARLEEAELPGLGVAVAVNLASTFCGMFGPNHSYTGFSSGMNQTARLQSLGRYRETLLMDSVHAALQATADPFCLGLSLSEIEQAQVKNVAEPLRYVKVLGAARAP
jgi:adenylate cyclase